MQGVLETALAELFGGARVAVSGAGRTDAGVHASGQVINFRTGSALPEVTIRRGVNALLPADVAVRDVVQVAETFHARHSATGRTYEYKIWNGRAPRPLLRGTATWVEEPLDLAAMRDGSRALVGRHDFSAFSRGSDTRSRERTCRRVEWRSDGELLVFEIEADAFLRGMVRGIVGTLLRVGLGKLAPGEVAAVLASRDRARGGQTAPPQGLCLAAVEYGDRVGSPTRITEEDDE